MTRLFVPARIRSRARQKGWGPFSNWYKSRGGCPPQPLTADTPLGGGLWARTCAVWCWLMQGSYRQGKGTNVGRLRVFSSAQAPWRVLLQALDRPSNSGKWNLGQYCTVQIRKGCVCSVYYQPNPSRRGGPLSRPPAGCALGSVGNPFDRVWPPTTSGHLQPIFSCVDSRGTHPLCVYVREYGTHTHVVCTWVCVG